MGDTIKAYNVHLILFSQKYLEQRIGTCKSTQVRKKATSFCISFPRVWRCSPVETHFVNRTKQWKIATGSTDHKERLSHFCWAKNRKQHFKQSLPELLSLISHMDYKQAFCMADALPLKSWISRCPSPLVNQQDFSIAQMEPQSHRSRVTPTWTQSSVLLHCRECATQPIALTFQLTSEPWPSPGIVLSFQQWFFLRIKDPAFFTLTIACSVMVTFREKMLPVIRLKTLRSQFQLPPEILHCHF